MSHFLNSEHLPRRNSLQFHLFKKKKIDIILKWVNLERMNNKKSDLTVQIYKKKLKLSCMSNISISLPFHRKTLEKNCLIVLPNSYRNLKYNVYKLLELSSVGKIENLNKFIQKLKSPYSQRDDMLRSGIIIFDKKLKIMNILKIKKFIKKLKNSIHWVNLNNNISTELIQALSKNKIIHHNSFEFFSQFTKKICKKNLQNNIINFIGGIVEKIPPGDDIISNISIKTELLPLINIYFNKNLNR